MTPDTSTMRAIQGAFIKTRDAFSRGRQKWISGGGEPSSGLEQVCNMLDDVVARIGHAADALDAAGGQISSDHKTEVIHQAHCEASGQVACICNPGPIIRVTPPVSAPSPSPAQARATCTCDPPSGTYPKDCPVHFADPRKPTPPPAQGETLEPGQWVHCSPVLIGLGVSCEHTPRRACECPANGSHDHFIAWNRRAQPLPAQAGATCRDPWHSAIQRGPEPDCPTCGAPPPAQGRPIPPIPGFERCADAPTFSPPPAAPVADGEAVRRWGAVVASLPSSMNATYLQLQEAGDALVQQVRFLSQSRDSYKWVADGRGKLCQEAIANMHAAVASMKEATAAREAAEARLAEVERNTRRLLERCKYELANLATKVTKKEPHGWEGSQRRVVLHADLDKALTPAPAPQTAQTGEGE